MNKILIVGGVIFVMIGGVMNLISTVMVRWWGWRGFLNYGLWRACSTICRSYSDYNTVGKHISPEGKLTKFTFLDNIVNCQLKKK